MPAAFAVEEQRIDVQSPVGGLVDTPFLNLLGNDQASICLNVAFDRVGIQKRLGRTVIGDDVQDDVVCNLVYHYRKRDGSYIILQVRDDGAGGAGRLYRLNNITELWEGFHSGNNPGTTVDDICAGGALISVVQYADDVYFADGGASPKMLTDGTNIDPWGYAGTSTLPAGTNGADTNGSLTAGEDYKWVWTLYNPTTGVETNPSDESAVFTASADPNDGKIISIAAIGVGNWDDRFSKIRVYRTRGGGQTFFFEAEIVIAGNFETDAQAGSLTIADSSLGDEVAYDNNPPPTALQYVVLFDKRVFGVDPSSPSQLRWSKESNPSAWPLTNAEDIELDAGDPITALFVLQGRLYVLKRGAGVFMISGQSDGQGGTAYLAEKLTSDYGCVSHFSVVVYENVAFWLDNKGWVRFDGNQLTNISDGKIRQTVNTFASSDHFLPAIDAGRTTGFAPYGIHDRRPDKPYIRTCVEHPDGDRYHVIYDASRDAWFLHLAASDTSGRSDRCFGLIRDLMGQHWVYVGDETGRVYRLETDIVGNPQYTDANEAYEMDWASRWFGDGYDQLLVTWLHLEGERPAEGKTSGLVTVTWQFDGDETEDVATRRKVFRLEDASTEGRQSWHQRIRVARRQSRRFRFRIRHSTTNGDVKIMSFGLRVKALPGRTVGL